MKVLVIGGTRYFGKRFVNKLIEHEHDVTILSRGNRPNDFGPNVKRIYTDRTDEKSLANSIGNETFDIVVDQICMNGQEAKSAINIFKDKTDHYILTSTLSVYPLRAHLKEADFDPLHFTPSSPANPAEAYAEGKRSAEAAFSQQASFKYSCLRIPIVLGEDDYTLRLEKHVESIYKGYPLFFPNLNARMSYLHAQDAARAILWLMSTSNCGIFNFASEVPITMRELILMIETETGRFLKHDKSNNENFKSPFGISNDWYMEVAKAKSAGFVASPLEEWLPHLIRHYSSLQK